MPGEPAIGDGKGTPPGETQTLARRVYELTPQQEARAVAAFESVLANAVVAYEVGQLGLFDDKDEEYIRKEGERMLYEPQLPRGGAKERRFIERLKRLTEDKEWDGCGRAHYAISQWQAVLPEEPRVLPDGRRKGGTYYTRRSVTPKTDAELFKWLRALKEIATESKNLDRAWFAQMMLDGLPEPVSNFEMECLFLLRKSDGSVDRLVRLRNVLGEVSKGTYHKGSDMLDPKAFAAPEKYREWALGRGNFAWGGNQKDLHKLQEDNAQLSAGKVINQVDSFGSLRLKKSHAEERINMKTPTEASTEIARLERENANAREEIAFYKKRIRHNRTAIKTMKAIVRHERRGKVIHIVRTVGFLPIKNSPSARQS